MLTGITTARNDDLLDSSIRFCGFVNGDRESPFQKFAVLSRDSIQLNNGTLTIETSAYHVMRNHGRTVPFEFSEIDGFSLRIFNAPNSRELFMAFDLRTIFPAEAFEAHDTIVDLIKAKQAIPSVQEAIAIIEILDIPFEQKKKSGM